MTFPHTSNSKRQFPVQYSPFRKRLLADSFPSSVSSTVNPRQSRLLVSPSLSVFIFAIISFCLRASNHCDLHPMSHSTTWRVKSNLARSLLRPYLSTHKHTHTHMLYRPSVPSIICGWTRDLCWKNHIGEETGAVIWHLTSFLQMWSEREAERASEREQMWAIKPLMVGYN